MVEMVKFTEKQCKVLNQLFVDANKDFDKCMAEKPYLYHECERDIFVRGYVESGFKHIIEDGYYYLEL